MSDTVSVVVGNAVYEMQVIWFRNVQRGITHQTVLFPSYLSLWDWCGQGSEPFCKFMKMGNVVFTQDQRDGIRGGHSG